MNKKNPDPIRQGLMFGLVGGITFAVFGTIFHFYRYREFSSSSIIGGISWFIISMALSFYVNKAGKSKD